MLYSLALMVKLEGIMVRVEELQEQALTQEVSLTHSLVCMLAYSLTGESWQLQQASGWHEGQT